MDFEFVFQKTGPHEGPMVWVVQSILARVPLPEHDGVRPKNHHRCTVSRSCTSTL